jgi:hypothetical protein
MTVHGDYAADKNVTGFDVSWNPRTAVWIVLMPQCLTLVGRSHRIYFLWLGEESAGISANSADASATTVQNIQFSRYFAQRRVLYFHDCTWRRSTPPTRMLRVSMFPGTRDGAMVRRLECLHQDWTTTYILHGWTRIPQESAKTRRTQVRPPYRIFPILDISLNDVSFSMTVHMERSTPPTRMLRVSMFPGTHDGAMGSSDASKCLYYGTGRSYNILSMAGQQIPQESAKTRRTQVRPPYRIFLTPDISQQDVSFTSMTAHGIQFTPPIRMLRVSTFPGNLSRCHGSSDASMPILLLKLDEATTYFLWLDNKPAGDSAVSTGKECNDG